MAENNPHLPVLPVFEDFFPDGPLDGIDIPDMGPIPKEVIKFMFGDEDYVLSKSYTFRILTYLHEIFLWDIQYCDCLKHILYKRKMLDYKDDFGCHDLSLESNVLSKFQKDETRMPYSGYSNHNHVQT